MENEFSGYSLEQLEKKSITYKKRHIFIMAFCGVIILILTIAAVIKKNNQLFQLVPFLIISGIAFPYLIFNPIRKKIQAEIKARKTP